VNRHTKVAVLGGAGFIGQHLLGALPTTEVRVFDKRAPEYDTLRHGLRGVDLTVRDDWEPVVKYRPDVLINLIANLSNRDTAIVVLRLVDAVLEERDWTPQICLLYTSPSPRDATLSRMPSSA